MYPLYRFDIEQNTDEWHNIKIGMFSASVTDKLLSGTNTKGFQELISRITEERLTGIKSDSIVFAGNKYTERGHEFEPIARYDYEYRNLVSVKQVGVIIKDEWCLCSPDGLIGDNKLIQIKCPIFSTHREYLYLAKNNTDIRKIIPGNYYKQMQFELYVSGLDINVFTSYHPNLRALDIEVKRDEQMIKEIEDRLVEAKLLVLNEIEIIKNL